MATKPELYAIDTNTPSPDRSIEAPLGLFETATTDPIKNLASFPTIISDNGRLTIAMFLAFQRGRTPAGLTGHLHVAQMAVEGSLHKFFGDRDKVADYVRAHINPNAGNNDIKAWGDVGDQGAQPSSPSGSSSPAQGSLKCRLRRRSRPCSSP